MMLSILRIGVIATLIAVGLPATAQTLSDPNLQVQTVIGAGSGLSQPTALRFLGTSANDFFVTEKATGQVKRFINGAPTTVLDLPVASESERGLLGIELHPNFGKPGQPNNDKVYLYYSRSSTGLDSGSGNWLDNRLVQFTWNGTSLTNETLIATFGSSSGQGGQATGPNHDGGPIKFGPDGKLYGIVGELNRTRAEQNNQAQASNSSFVGGIYRLNDDGSIPSDNPFFGNANPDFRRWYAYGVRNSFGLTFDPANGGLWDTENGPSSYDEINRVASGFNSGWTVIMGPDSRSTGNVSGLVNLGASSTYSDPEFSWLTPVAVTSINFLQGSSLGTAYNNKVLVGDNNNGFLYLFTLNAARDGFVLTGGLSDLVADSSAERDQVRIGQGFGVVSDLERGPDGFVYAVNLANGQIYRLVPESPAWLLTVVGAAGMTLNVVRWKNLKRLCANDTI